MLSTRLKSVFIRETPNNFNTWNVVASQAMWAIVALSLLTHPATNLTQLHRPKQMYHTSQHISFRKTVSDFGRNTTSSTWSHSEIEQLCVSPLVTLALLRWPFSWSPVWSKCRSTFSHFALILLLSMRRDYSKLPLRERPPQSHVHWYLFLPQFAPYT